MAKLADTPLAIDGNEKDVPTDLYHPSKDYKELSAMFKVRRTSAGITIPATIRDGQEEAAIPSASQVLITYELLENVLSHLSFEASLHSSASPSSGNMLHFVLLHYAIDLVRFRTRISTMKSPPTLWRIRY